MEAPLYSRGNAERYKWLTAWSLTQRMNHSVTGWRCQLVKNRQESAKSCLSASWVTAEGGKPTVVTASSRAACLSTWSLRLEELWAELGEDDVVVTATSTWGCCFCEDKCKEDPSVSAELHYFQCCKHGHPRCAPEERGKAGTFRGPSSMQLSAGLLQSGLSAWDLYLRIQPVSPSALCVWLLKYMTSLLNFELLSPAGACFASFAFSGWGLSGLGFVCRESVLERGKLETQSTRTNPSKHWYQEISSGEHFCMF